MGVESFFFFKLYFIPLFILLLFSVASGYVFELEDVWEGGCITGFSTSVFLYQTLSLLFPKKACWLEYSTLWTVLSPVLIFAVFLASLPRYCASII